MLSFHLPLGLPKVPYPVGLPVKILKALLPSCILANFLGVNHPEYIKWTAQIKLKAYGDKFYIFEFNGT